MHLEWKKWFEYLRYSLPQPVYQFTLVDWFVVVLVIGFALSGFGAFTAIATLFSGS